MGQIYYNQLSLDMNFIEFTNKSPEILVSRNTLGEWDVRLTKILQELIASVQDIRISAQVQNADDWVKLLLLIDAVKGKAYKSITVALPYLPYGRADRRFTDGDCFGVDVFLRTLAYAGVKIRTLDAHSNVGRTWNVKSSSAVPYIVRSITDVAIREKTKRIALVFPDEGAKCRYALPCTFGNNHHEIVCNQYFGEKQRDQVSGKITGLALASPSEDVVLVVDDICDGGRTFTEVAKLLGERTKYLYVTHFIGSQGWKPLEGYKRIYTTDSIDRTEWFDKLGYDFMQKVTEFNSSEGLWKNE